MDDDGENNNELLLEKHEQFQSNMLKPNMFC